MQENRISEGKWLCWKKLKGLVCFTHAHTDSFEDTTRNLASSRYVLNINSPNNPQTNPTAVSKFSNPIAILVSSQKRAEIQLSYPQTHTYKRYDLLLEERARVAHSHAEAKRILAARGFDPRRVCEGWRRACPPVPYVVMGRGQR